MSSVRLEYDKCPTCDSDTFIGRNQSDPKRILSIACSDVDCLHYASVSRRTERHVEPN